MIDGGFLSLVGLPALFKGLIDVIRGYERMRNRYRTWTTRRCEFEKGLAMFTLRLKSLCDEFNKYGYEFDRSNFELIKSQINTICQPSLDKMVNCMKAIHDNERRGKRSHKFSTAWENELDKNQAKVEHSIASLQSSFDHAILLCQHEWWVRNAQAPPQLPIRSLATWSTSRDISPRRRYSQPQLYGLTYPREPTVHQQRNSGKRGAPTAFQGHSKHGEQSYQGRPPSKKPRSRSRTRSHHKKSSDDLVFTRKKSCRDDVTVRRLSRAWC